MGKKQKKVTQQRMYESSKAKDSMESGGGNSLKDLLQGDTLAKLKAHAESMKQAETDRQKQLAEQKAKEEREERKRLENDFSYLLENSDMNWSKYK